MGKLIILRGNSGSGKTTVAKELQKKFGYNTMLISQDEIRRNILWVKDGIDTKALPLMIELLKYGYEHSDIVILEGIMYEEWYNPLFEVANELYDSNVYSYYFDIPFEETIKRHQTRRLQILMLLQCISSRARRKRILLYLLWMMRYLILQMIRI